MKQKATLKQIAKELKVRKAIKLNGSGAFHSPLMADVREDLKKVLDILITCFFITYFSCRLCSII